jgi:hypothetical protein
MRNLSEKNLAELSAGIDAGKRYNEIKLTPPKPKKPRNNEESRSQRNFFRWWNLVCFSEFKLPRTVIHSVPNGGFRNIVTASIMKAEGQSAGVFDVKVNVARNGYHGAWLEFKAEKGVLSNDQKQFKLNMEDQGYFTAVVYNYDQAVKIVTDYLK